VKKLLIIISILLIFPTTLFAADCAWLLWRYWITTIPYQPTGSWSLINALNSRNECLDALLKEHIGFYERYLDDPTSEVTPKPNETELRCLQSFCLASKSEPVSEACKTLITYFVMSRTDKEGIKSKLTLNYTDKIILQMRKEGKTKEEIYEYLKASDNKHLLSISKIEFWCLPPGVDPKTIGNKY
jgi:hypothetical protein